MGTNEGANLRLPRVLLEFKPNHPALLGQRESKTNRALVSEVSGIRFHKHCGVEFAHTSQRKVKQGWVGRVLAFHAVGSEVDILREST